MTTQTVYEAKDFLFSSKEEALMFEEKFDIDGVGDFDFSCQFVLKKDKVVSAYVTILTDIDTLFEDEYLTGEVDIFLFSRESSDRCNVKRIYRVTYYVDDNMMDVYKKSSIHSEQKYAEDCAFLVADEESSQYWIRVVNGATLKKPITSADAMRKCLRELFNKKVF